MPFNNITSWKVENTYGIVMGMFVMNDAQAAGISTMQNPTVIFEQDLSFSGHAPSTLVDQAYFNCPMVTVYSTLSPVMSPGGSVLSYVAGLSVNNSGDWIGDLNWEVATVTDGSSTALMDIGGHLIVESSGALLDHNFSPTGIAADEICLNWQLIDESGVELSSGSECIDFIPLSEPTTNTAPQISSVVITPSSPLESDVLTCTYTYSDVDNDPDASSVTWMINGVTATTTGSTLSSGYAAGDSVICSVFAYDGVDYGNVETTTVLIDTNSTGSGGSSSGGGFLPAIGAVGTLVAIGAGFFAILRREDDE
jgi:hypothetical protein